MAERGFGFLGWNTRFRGNEPYFQLDHALAEIGVGVAWLRDQGVEEVVLLGNSGGGSLMAAYQSQCKDVDIRPSVGRPVFRGLYDLAPADYMIFLAAHPGRPEYITGAMDPSLTDEFDPTSIDPSLDMYDARNGVPFSDEFLQRYGRAQVARNARITEYCLAELDRLPSLGTLERLFVMNRTWANPRFLDPTIDPSNRPVGRCYFGDPARANRNVFGVGMVTSLRTWLNMFSLTESDCVVDSHLPKNDLPTLVVHADADMGVFPADAQKLLDLTGADDKQLVTLPGGHYFNETSEARPNVADHVAAWLQARVSN
nr:hypothetical protein [Ilumatobacter nonamiensis]